jgi:hypothetical protein
MINPNMENKNLEELKESLLQKTKECNKPERENMGLGVLGHHQTNFVRKFRWTLLGNGLCENFVKKVYFDFVNQTIHMQVMEVSYAGATDIDIQRWLGLDLSKEFLLFTTYDGCGNAIYEYEFLNFELLEDKADFDYSCSEESVREVALKYDHCRRQFLATEKRKEPTVVKKRMYWRVQLEGEGPEYEVKVDTKPNIDIEETEINFLNAKTFIPGKATWQDLHLSFERQHDMGLLIPFLLGKETNLHLHLYSYDNKTKLETWVLKSCKLNSMNHEEDKCNLKVRFANAHYSCCMPIGATTCQTIEQ